MSVGPASDAEDAHPAALLRTNSSSRARCGWISTTPELNPTTSVTTPMSSDEENFSIPSRPPDPSDEPETEDESADEVKTEPPRAVFIAGDPEGRTLGDEYADDEAGSTGKGILEDLIDRGEADRRASRNRRRPLNDPPAVHRRGRRNRRTGAPSRSEDLSLVLRQLILLSEACRVRDEGNGPLESSRIRWL